MTNDEMIQQKKITDAGNPAKPTGEAGEKMLARMNESHAALTAWGLSFFYWQGDEEVLDIGCGGGANLRRMSGHIKSGHLTGVDYAKTSVETSRQTNAADIAAGKMDIREGSVEALPFADGGFTHVAAVDVVEHARDPEAFVAECGRQLTEGGRLWISATNRLWPGPHPSVGLWAAGWLPASVRRGRLIRLRGVDSLRFVQLLSPFRVMRACHERGLRILRRRPRAVSGGGVLRRTYARLSTTPGVSALLFVAGPAFQLIAARPQGERP